MSADVDNIVLEHLRHIRAKVDTLSDDMRSLYLRMGSLEQHMAAFHTTDIDQNIELDRLKRRVDRIEQRLELTE